MRQFIAYSLMLLGLIACIDQVQLPIRTETPQLVVEGQLTNEAPPYTVRLTYTGKYSGSGQDTISQYVQGAQVLLGDDQGHTTSFAATAPGRYQSVDSTFRGQVGRAYSLTVVLGDGKRYVTKAEQMPAVPAIDSISADVIATTNLAKPYQVAYSVSLQDPASEKNYYRWTGYGYTTRQTQGVACCTGCLSTCYNNCWIPVSSEQVNIFSDEAINGNPLRKHAVLQIPIYSLFPQLVEIQQYAMTQANYQFWKLYQQQDTRTGSIFDPLPAPVTGNLVNANVPTDIARGYFAVTSITRQRYRTKTYASRFYYAMTSYIFNIQLYFMPSGDCRKTYGQVPVVQPEGWQ